MTVLYLIRHSTRLSSDYILDYKTEQGSLLRNEKDILSIEGEERAKILSEEDEFKNIKKIYVSNCVRTLQTAKYMMKKYGIKAVIDERLDERRVGDPNDGNYPDSFVRQYQNADFKTKGGESQNDVLIRMNEVINEILDKSSDEEIAIFSHGYAICFYLLQFCQLEHIDMTKSLKITYKGKDILNGQLNAPEVFKLTFDEKKLVDIDHIIFSDL